MTSSTTRARHRAARRPITPLTMLASAASDNVISVGKRSAIVAASSGLLVSLMAAAPASAAQVSSEAAVASVDVAALASEARAALSTAPTVTVAADASWTVEQTDISVTPAPEPVKVVTPTRTTTAASRTAERTSVSAASTATTAAATTTAATTSTAAASTAAATTQTASAATTTKTAAATSVAPASAAGSSIIDIASRYVGVPYVSGGSTPSGFDCSGFTSYVFAQAGISLPRTSGEQRNVGTVISRDQAQPGDLIYSPGHIAIYAGGNSQIDAPKPGKTVQFREIWQSNPVFIRIS